MHLSNDTSFQNKKIFLMSASLVFPCSLLNCSIRALNILGQVQMQKEVSSVKWKKGLLKNTDSKSCCENKIREVV